MSWSKLEAKDVDAIVKECRRVLRIVADSFKHAVGLGDPLTAAELLGELGEAIDDIVIIDLEVPK